jgi:hypothetical protein
MVWFLTDATALLRYFVPIDGVITVIIYLVPYLAHDIAYHALDCAFIFALVTYCELRGRQGLDDGYGGLRVHLPCPT